MINCYSNKLWIIRMNRPTVFEGLSYHPYDTVIYDICYYFALLFSVNFPSYRQSTRLRHTLFYWSFRNILHHFKLSMADAD